MTKPKPDYVCLVWRDDTQLTRESKPWWSAKQWREDNNGRRKHPEETVAYRILVRLKNKEDKK